MAQQRSLVRRTGSRTLPYRSERRWRRT
jgi:hypothetical protein